MENLGRISGALYFGNVFMFGALWRQVARKIRLPRFRSICRRAPGPESFGRAGKDNLWVGRKSNPRGPSSGRRLRFIGACAITQREDRAWRLFSAPKVVSSAAARRTPLQEPWNVNRGAREARGPRYKPTQLLSDKLPSLQHSPQ